MAPRTPATAPTASPAGKKGRETSPLRGGAVGGDGGAPHGSPARDVAPSPSPIHFASRSARLEHTPHAFAMQVGEFTAHTAAHVGMWEQRKNAAILSLGEKVDDLKRSAFHPVTVSTGSGGEEMAVMGALPSHPPGVPEAPMHGGSEASGMSAVTTRAVARRGSGAAAARLGHVWERDKAIALLALEDDRMRLRQQVMDAAHQEVELEKRAELEREALQARMKGERRGLEERLEKTLMATAERHVELRLERLVRRCIGALRSYARKRPQRVALAAAETRWWVGKRRSRQLAALSAWRGLAADVRRHAAATRRAAARRRRGTLRVCLTCWSEWAARGGLLRRRYSILVARGQTPEALARRLAPPFGAWHEIAAAAARRARVLHRAIERWQRDSVAAAWFQWASIAASSRARREAAEGMGRTSLGRAAVAAWRASAAESAGRKLTLRRAAAVLFRSNQRRALLSWRAVTERAGVTTRRVAAAQGAAGGRWARRVLLEWQGAAHRGTKLARLLSRAREGAKLRALRWGLYALYHARRLGRAERKVTSSRTRRVLSGALVWWAEHAARQRVLGVMSWRVAARAPPRTLRAAFARWSRCAAQGQRERMAFQRDEAALRAEGAKVELVASEAARAAAETDASGQQGLRAGTEVELGRALARAPVWMGGAGGLLAPALRCTAMPSSGPVPGPRAGHTATWVPQPSASGDEELYTGAGHLAVFGGHDGRDWLGGLHVLRVDSAASPRAQWCPRDAIQVSGQAPSPRADHAACAVGSGRVLLAGGYDGHREAASTHLLTLSPSGAGVAAVWAEVASGGGGRLLPPPLSQHTLSHWPGGEGGAGAALMFGGYRAAAGHTNDLLLLDLKHLKWHHPEVAGDPPVPRRGHVAAVCGDFLFVHGGFDGHSHLGDLYQLDLHAMLWSKVGGAGQGPSPRRHHGAEVVGSTLVIHGGFDGLRYLHDTWALEMGGAGGGTWRELSPVPQPSLPSPRSMHTLTRAGGGLLVLGGVDEEEALGDALLIENGPLADGLLLQRRHLDVVRDLGEALARCAGLEAEAADCRAAAEAAVAREARVKQATEVLAQERATAVRVSKELRRKLLHAREALAAAEARDAASGAELAATQGNLARAVRKAEAGMETAHELRRRTRGMETQVLDLDAECDDLHAQLQLASAQLADAQRLAHAAGAAEAAMRGESDAARAAAGHETALRERREAELGAALAKAAAAGALAEAEQMTAQRAREAAAARAREAEEAIARADERASRARADAAAASAVVGGGGGGAAAGGGDGQMEALKMQLAASRARERALEESLGKCEAEREDMAALAAREQRGREAAEEVKDAALLQARQAREHAAEEVARVQAAAERATSQRWREEASGAAGGSDGEEWV